MFPTVSFQGITPIGSAARILLEVASLALWVRALRVGPLCRPSKRNTEWPNYGLASLCPTVVVDVKRDWP